MKTASKCPLCGKDVDEAATRCRGCLLAKNCDLPSCPHCGYSFQERSALVDLLKTSWRGEAKS